MTLSLLNLTLINIHITQQERAKNLEPKEVYLSQLQYKDKSNVAYSANNQSPEFKFRFVFFHLQMLHFSALCGQI